LRGLALNFTGTHQVGNSAGISKVCDNKQLLIAIVVQRFIPSVSYSLLKSNLRVKIA
jgi:hypothetical protein